MESPELTCKKIANKLFYYLHKEFRSPQVLFAKDGKSASLQEEAKTFSVTLPSIGGVEHAVVGIITNVPKEPAAFIELLIPPNITGVVVTANNISIRVLKSPFEQSFLATICWK